MHFFWPASSFDEQARDGGAIWPGQAFVEHHVLPPMRLRPDLHIHSVAKPPRRSITAFISHS